jgi:hypothetical protein
MEGFFKKIYKLVFEKFIFVFLFVIISSFILLLLFITIYQNFILPSSTGLEEQKSSFQQRFQNALQLIGQNKTETEFTESLIDIFNPR